MRTSPWPRLRRAFQQERALAPQTPLTLIHYVTLEQMTDVFIASVSSSGKCRDQGGLTVTVPAERGTLPEEPSTQWGVALSTFYLIKHSVGR